MIKQLLFSFLSLFFVFSSSAQVEEAGLSFGEKSQLRKALKVEAYTLDGNQHKGYLYSADSSKIYLTENPLVNDSITSIQAEDLYQIKVKSHIPFGKRFLSGITFSAAVMTIFTAEIYSHGDDIMIGPDFVIVAGTTFFGTPFSLLTALLFPNELTDFEYRIDGQAEAFIMTSKFFKKRQIRSTQPVEENVKQTHIVKDKENLKKIVEPIKFLHPEAVNSVHFMFGSTFSLTDLSRQLEKGLWYTEYSSTGHLRGDRISYFVKLQGNISPKIRPYVSFIIKETGYGSARLNTINTDWLSLDYTAVYGHIGADYIFKPINNVGLSPFEFSLGSGIGYANINYGYSPKTGAPPSAYERKTYYAFGIEFTANADYYFSRNLSLNISLSTNLLSSIQPVDIQYTTLDNIPLVLNVGSFQSSSLHLGFGLRLHL